MNLTHSLDQPEHIGYEIFPESGCPIVFGLDAIMPGVNEAYRNADTPTHSITEMLGVLCSRVRVSTHLIPANRRMAGRCLRRSNPAVPPIKGRKWFHSQNKDFIYA
jgi:hypothetical protein